MTPHNLRVLIVDDNRTDRLVVKAILQKLRVMTAHEAENGAVAESKILTARDISEPYDLVMLDWHMPRANGLKLLQFLRSESKLKNVKVIVMTATSQREVVEEAVKNGAHDFIVKPVELSLLEQKIKKVSDQNPKFW